MRRVVIPMQTWHVYALTPIDVGWELLPKASPGEIPEQVRMAAREMYWEGDFSEGPVRFMVPNELQFEGGFAWKQSNNGTTYVACTVPLSHLDAHSVE